MTDPMSRVRAELPVRRGTPDDYLTNCPGPMHSNGDKKPSLHVSRGGPGRQAVVLHCFAGCSVDEVLNACDLTYADICDGENDKPSPNVKGWRGYY